MIERAGVDMDPAYALAPGALHGFLEQPAPMAEARHVRREADEGELALAVLAKIELEHSNVATVPVDDGEQLDLRILDDGRKLVVVHDQSRKPQPWRSDEAEKLAISPDVRVGDALQIERRAGNSDDGPLTHFEVGHDRGKFVVRHSFVTHFHLAKGGRLIRIASMLPPVLSPNRVPRS